MRQTHQYSDAFKEQILKECQEVGNVSVVSRRHDISPNTVHSWIRKYRERGTVTTMNSKSTNVEQQALAQLRKVSTENDRLKRLVAEKELELAILKDLRDQANPK